MVVTRRRPLLGRRTRSRHAIPSRPSQAAWHLVGPRVRCSIRSVGYAAPTLLTLKSSSERTHGRSQEGGYLLAMGLRIAPSLTRSMPASSWRQGVGGVGGWPSRRGGGVSSYGYPPRAVNSPCTDHYAPAPSC